MLSDATLQTLDMKVNRQKVILFCHLSVIACCYLLLAAVCIFTDFSDAPFCFLKVKVLYAVINSPLAFCSFLYLKIRENQLLNTSSASVQCFMEY